MTAPTFNKKLPRLYELSSTVDVQTILPAYWAGYCSSINANFGDQASLEQIWNDVGGVYLFVSDIPNDFDFQNFLNGLLKLLPRLSPTGTIRILWIDKPTLAWDSWQTQALNALPTDPPSTQTWKIDRQENLHLGNYSVFVQGGIQLTLNNSTETGFGIQFKDPGIKFIGPGNGYPAQSNTAQLPFTGQFLGALICKLLLKKESENIYAGLGVMLRYSTPDPESPAGEVKSLPMPVLRQADSDIILDLSFDPLYPLIADRCHLGFVAGDAGALPSAFSTSRGHAITLTPYFDSAALTSARFAFCRTPIFVSEMKTNAETYFDYYLTADGSFSITIEASKEKLTDATAITVDSISNGLMFGLNGIECVSLPATGNAIMYFESGQKAYVPALSKQDDNKDNTPAISDLGTTAYLTVLPASGGSSGLTYYSQPIQAPLFQAATGLGSGFLDFHSMPAATLSAYPTVNTIKPKVQPAGIYKWLELENIHLAQTLENAVLAPLRRKAIGLPNPPELVQGKATSDAILATTANPSLAVTPKGLVAKLTNDLQAWAGIVLANMPASVHTEVELTQVKPEFQAALQSNQLFFVTSNVENFMQQSSVQYQLTLFDMELLAAKDVPPTVIDSLKSAYGPGYAKYPNETSFLDKLPDDAKPYKPTILAVAGIMEADMEGWTFQLSPRAWRSDANNPTLMLFKFNNRSLLELANDPHSWGWQQAAWDGNESTKTTQQQLLAIIQDTIKRKQERKDKADDPFVIFYNEVINNPLWNGVLFLNAPVDFTQMPEPLQFLAAGIDTQQFYAHHVGFSVTPFTPTTTGIDLHQTAAFGLINYEDPTDLVASSTIPLGFKTLQLQVRFANAHVVDFSAQVELMLNNLLGSPLSKTEPARGNNLIMNGSYQRVGGVPAYSFDLIGQNTFSAQNTALVDLEILAVHIETGGGDDPDTVLSKFTLMGNMRFILIEGFDLFSYGATVDNNSDGYLRFNGLEISMRFQRATPEQQIFIPNEGATSFDSSNSITRDAALMNNFPLVINSLIASPNLSEEGQAATGQTPENMGFTSIGAPLDQTPMTPSWYGLNFTLDLGTLGALTGSIGFKISLLAAWSEGQSPTDPPVYLGLKIPNIPALGGSFPLQGVLKLGFRSFQFETYITDEQNLGYMLRLRRFALSLLAWSFPPGNTDILLFGEPGNPKGSLGWYAAYDDGKKPTTKQKMLSADTAQTSLERRLQSGRRTPPVK